MYDDIANVTDDSTQYGMRLCNAVKSHRCLYDPQTVGYRQKSTINAAWKLVSKECKDKAANCRFRWKTIRARFTKSYKKYGDSHDKNDESINEDVNKSLLESGINENNEYSDSETTKSAEESQKNTTIIQNISTDSLYDTKTEDDHNDGIHDQKITRSVKFQIDVDNNELEDSKNYKQQEVHNNESHSQKTSVNESHAQKTSVNHSVHFTENVIVLENETTDSQPSLPEENTGRRLRDRKMPKRFVDMDFSPERPAEKRPRRVIQRRKSVGGMVLKEFALRNSLPDFPYTPNNANITRPKPKFTPEITSYCDTTVDDHNIYKHIDNNIHKIFLQDASALAKPVMIDSFTTTDFPAASVSVGTQYEAEPRRPDDLFLDTLKPQMDIMNLRQKVNFKRRVYQAIMEVLDDGTNFPKENEIVEAATAVAADFKATTSGELKLMRELVSLVQAAKTTPELGENILSIKPIASAEVASAYSPTTIPICSTPPNQHIQTGEKQVTPPNQNLQPKPNSGNEIIPASSAHSLGIPRHVIQKAVKVAGSNGSTIMTHDGDKTRVYRIYPKTATATGSPKSVIQSTIPNATTPHATSPSTFFVQPSNPINKPAINPSSPTTNQRNSSPSNIKVIPISNVISKAMLPPSSNRSPAFTNAVNKSTTMTPPHNTGVPSQGPGKIIQRRYSICGPAPTKNQPISAQNRKPYIRTAVVHQQPPPLQRIQKFPHQQELRKHVTQTQQLGRQPPRSSPAQVVSGCGPMQSSVSKIHMSKPISLNTAANNLSQPIKHIPAINDNCRPRMVEPLPLREPELIVPQPDPQNSSEFLSSSEAASILEMAGTIAADNFGSFFNKPIKDEPEE